MTVHTSATTREHLNEDLLLPNTRGYLRIALNFVEHIAMAALMGWLNPGSRMAPNRVGSIGIISSAHRRQRHICSRQNNLQSIVQILCRAGCADKEDTLKPILRGASMDDFITKVACIADEICKWAVDGVVSLLSQTSQHVVARQRI